MAEQGNSVTKNGNGALAKTWERGVFQSLPLTLSARLAAGRVKVGQLRSVVPGTILPLETPVGEPSRLVAEGVVVAAGEIVEIQGHLALRLTRLGHGGEDE
jgi:type III secretion protein Q